MMIVHHHLHPVLPPLGLVGLATVGQEALGHNLPGQGCYHSQVH